MLPAWCIEWQVEGDHCPVVSDSEKLTAPLHSVSPQLHLQNTRRYNNQAYCDSSRENGVLFYLTSWQVHAVHAECGQLGVKEPYPQYTARQLRVLLADPVLNHLL